jgi:hypothetical protein
LFVGSLTIVRESIRHHSLPVLRGEEVLTFLATTVFRYYVARGSSPPRHHGLPVLRGEEVLTFLATTVFRYYVLARKVRISGRGGW